MPKFPFKKAVIGAGVAGLTGVGGTAGYIIGKRKGAESAATEMASAFSEANQQENQQLARHYFQKGLQYKSNFKKGSSMDKQAALQEIYNESFNDEIEKMAGKVPGIKSIKNVAKQLYTRTPKHNVGKAVAGAKKMYQSAASGVRSGASATQKAAQAGATTTSGAFKTLYRNAAQKKVLIPAAAAVGGIGVGAGGMALANR